MGRARHVMSSIALVAMILALGACDSGRDDGAPAPTTVLPRPTLPGTAADGPDTSLPSPEAAETLPGEPSSVAPEPTGVPGLESEVPFCRAYVRFTGTYRVLIAAMSFGEISAEEVATLEVAASPAVTRAAAAVLGEFPEELADERDLVSERIIGPFQRRAERAVSELGLAGADGASLDRLEQWWLQVLQGLDNQSVDVERPAFGSPDDEQLAEAARAFRSALVPLINDPTLVREGVLTPGTDAYVARECPEAAAVTAVDEI